ncbi:kinase-like domain-containing protein [Amanita rubescens]|nr:kinase-like domain-containing protein [Amanita rubescens]
MQLNQGSHVLPSLLSILHDNKPGSIPPGDSVVNASTISLICKLLYKEDYVDVAEQLNQAEDVKNLLDFILHLLRGLPGDDMGLKRRARRLMFKIISRMPVIPSSLILTGVSMPEKRDYIGSGGFGRVFKGELQGAIVALKVLYKSGNDVAFCREALMWRSLTHKFVLPFLGIYELEDGTTPQFFLVSPYMTNGNLAQWRKKVNPSVAEVKERILEVAQGMEYIHSEGAVHGDLRGENILLDADLHVQIADFGLTRHSEATNTRSGGLHVNFAAPELFGFCEDEDDSSDDVPARTQMSDVYAFGCLYYEIHYDSIPFAGKQDLQILTLISRGILPPRLDEPPLSDRAWNVIRCCWVREASERPRMKEITENMMSVTLPMSLPIKARDSFQELFELRTIPAQTLTVLRQELGLDDRDPSRMTSAQRVRRS